MGNSDHGSANTCRTVVSDSGYHSTIVRHASSRSTFWKHIPWSTSLLLSSLELSDTAIHAPYIRALLGTAPHFCSAVFLKTGEHQEHVLEAHRVGLQPK